MIEEMALPPHAYSSAYPGDPSSIGAGNPFAEASLIPAQNRSWTLWLGPGVRPDLADRIESGPGLQGQGRLHRTLTDLAELLARDVGAGRLVATVREIPMEDIGILRRFLERNPARELVLLGLPEDLAPPALLLLPRTRVLPKPISAAMVAWLGTVPEHLERRLRHSSQISSPEADENSSPVDRIQMSWQLLKDRLAGRADLAPLLGRLEIELNRSQGTAKEETPLVDLGTLAEELLATLSLERSQRTRFLFRPEGELNVAQDRTELKDCLKGLFRLAGRCSTPDSVIRVRVSSLSGDEPDPDAFVEVYVEFPDSPLQGIAVGDELDPEIIGAHFGPDLASSLRSLLRDIKVLEGELTSTPTRPGRRGIRLRIQRLGQCSAPATT